MLKTVLRDEGFLEIELQFLFTQLTERRLLLQSERQLESVLRGAGGQQISYH